LTSDSHLDLDAPLLANFDLVDSERVALEQPADHLRHRHDVGFCATVGDRFLGERLDPCLDPIEFVGLAQSLYSPSGRY
jgi:hypothetical protein